MKISQWNGSELVKALALQQGFESCGIARAEPLPQEARRLEAWLHKGLHGDMGYMERHFDLRVNPCLLVPGAKSVITVLKNYYPAQQQQPLAPKISKYAFGQDYHTVIRKQLNQFLAELRKAFGQIEGRGFVDSAPVLERAWATKSGLGWVGKNGNLINKKLGSFYFIATLITDLVLEPDAPFTADHCGTCTRCIDACPTSAILPNKVVDGSRCISYFTIELKSLLIPNAMAGQFDNWMFGCDTCQDVCPWNRFSKPNDEPAFSPLPQVLNLSTAEWEALTEVAFSEAFKHSPIKRAKYAGVKRNLKFLNRDTDLG